MDVPFGFGVVVGFCVLVCDRRFPDDTKIANAIDPKQLAKDWNDERKQREGFDQDAVLVLKDEVLEAVEFLKQK